MHSSAGGRAADSVRGLRGQSVGLGHRQSAGEATLVQYQRRNAHLWGRSPEIRMDGCWIQQGLHLFGKQLLLNMRPTLTQLQSALLS